MGKGFVIAMIGVGFAGAALLGGRSSSGGGGGSSVEPYPTRADLHPVPDLSRTTGERRPGVEAFRDYVLARWGGQSAGIWGDAKHGAQSDHMVGRAWDWHPPDYAAARDCLEWLFAAQDGASHAMARRCGIVYAIWNRFLYAAYDPKPFGGRVYTGQSPHLDHVHFSFTKAGAMGETSAHREGLLG